MAMINEWAKREMENVNLSDKRLNDRLTKVLSMLGEKPHLSIPAALNGGHNEVTAAYHLFDNSKASFGNILESHIDATYERVAQQKVVIVAQDTTELDLTKPELKVVGAGPLDDGARVGELLHPLIAFTQDGTPLGVLYAQLWTRLPIEPEAKKTKRANEKDRKHTSIEEKESLRWLETQRHAQEIAKEISDTHFISVADSEADIFEVIQLGDQSPKNFDWIIRAGQNRGLEVDGDGEQGEDDVEKLLIDRVSQQKILFTQSISARGRKAKVSCETRGRRQPRESRDCDVAVRAMTLTLRAPWRHDRVLEDTQVNVVLVSEINPPEGDVPIQWVLITSLPIDTVEAVLLVIRSYCSRWMIEVYFRTLKSCCHIEDLRFEHIDRFERCLAVYMIVAWRTLFTVRLGREFPDMNCEAIFEPDEWRSVYQFITKQAPPKTPPSLQEMIRMIAQLGGYIQRSRDDEPGPQTVSLGMQRMHDISQCWRAFGPGSRTGK
jgi:hypothetical protein